MARLRSCLCKALSELLCVPYRSGTQHTLGHHVDTAVRAEDQREELQTRAECRMHIAR